MRMAVADNKTPARALLHALLAFSSMRRSGLSQQAIQFKISALQALSASARDGPGTTSEAAQIVAASMLLGAFEVRHKNTAERNQR
jgi:hypothetical protein